MRGLGRNGTADVFVRASSARNRDIYQRYATGLYRLAFWTLGDAALAEHVVRAVIVGEYALAPAAGQDEDDTRQRLAESVSRRCQQLAAGPAGRDSRPARPPSGTGDGCVDPGGLLSEQERGALGLVLIGGLGYVRAARVLGICPHDMAALLRTALLKLGTSPAAVAGDGSGVGGPAAGGQ
jgi:DNA-directed RNA polymerase specialized sigma24 family protein